jgi:hypothetical protein
MSSSNEIPDRDVENQDTDNTQAGYCCCIVVDPAFMNRLDQFARIVDLLPPTVGM